MAAGAAMTGGYVEVSDRWVRAVRTIALVMALVIAGLVGFSALGGPPTSATPAPTPGDTRCVLETVAGPCS